MELETLNDLITWSRDLHRYIGRCLHQQLPHQQDQHASLLMNYLTEQEQKIAEIIEEFHQQADPAILNTWCLEYLKKQHYTANSPCDVSFASMSADDITGEVMRHHDEVIDLLTSLQGRVEGEARSALVDNLLQLEKQETMRMSQSANRWRDI